MLRRERLEGIRYWVKRSGNKHGGPFAFLDRLFYLVKAMTFYIKNRTELESLARILAECGAKRVLLFGSVARGEDKAESDIDLACVGVPSVRFFEAFGKLLFVSGRDVDLIDLDEAKESLRKRIEKEGVLLYEERRSSSTS